MIHSWRRSVTRPRAKGPAARQCLAPGPPIMTPCFACVLRGSACGRMPSFPRRVAAGALRPVPGGVSLVSWVAREECLPQWCPSRSLSRVCCRSCGGDPRVAAGGLLSPAGKHVMLALHRDVTRKPYPPCATRSKSRQAEACTDPRGGNFECGFPWPRVHEQEHLAVSPLLGYRGWLGAPTSSHGTEPKQRGLGMTPSWTTAPSPVASSRATARSGRGRRARHGPAGGDRPSPLGVSGPQGPGAGDREPSSPPDPAQPTVFVARHHAQGALGLLPASRSLACGMPWVVCCMLLGQT